VQIFTDDGDGIWSRLELLRLAEIGFSAASYALAQQTCCRRCLNEDAPWFRPWFFGGFLVGKISFLVGNLVENRLEMTLEWILPGFYGNSRGN
jgi:hypothetical protein